MERIFVCNMPSDDVYRCMGLIEMKMTLDSLVLQIAKNNDILEEDSLLYSRLIADCKENTSNLNNFWQPYKEKYGNMLSDNTRFLVDRMECKLYVAPIND